MIFVQIQYHLNISHLNILTMLIAWLLVTVSRVHWKYSYYYFQPKTVLLLNHPKLQKHFHLRFHNLNCSDCVILDMWIQNHLFCILLYDDYKITCMMK